MQLYLTLYCKLSQAVLVVIVYIFFYLSDLEEVSTFVARLLVLLFIFWFVRFFHI